MFSKSLHSFFVPHLFTKLSRLSQYFKWNLTQRLAFAEQFLGSSSHSLQEYELEQLLHLKLVTKRNENMINTSEEKNGAFTDQGWNHFKHTRVAVALARGIFFCFLAKKTKQKNKKTIENSRVPKRQLYTYAANDSTPRINAARYISCISRKDTSTG